MGSSASSSQNTNHVNMCQIQNIQTSYQNVKKDCFDNKCNIPLNLVDKSNILLSEQVKGKLILQPKSMRDVQKKKEIKKQKTQFKLKKTRENNENDIVTGLDQIQEMIIEKKKQLNPIKKSTISDKKVLSHHSKTDGLVPLIPLRELTSNWESQTRSKRFRVSKLL